MPKMGIRCLLWVPAGTHWKMLMIALPKKDKIWPTSVKIIFRRIMRLLGIFSFGKQFHSASWVEDKIYTDDL